MNTLKNLKKTVHVLCEEIGGRAPGSWEELKAAQYIDGEFKKIGIESQIAPFKSPSHLAVKSLLKDKNTGEKFESYPQQFSPAGRVSGKIVYLGDCEDSAILENGLSGKIGLLIVAGDLFLRHKMAVEMEKRGLKALIVASTCSSGIPTKTVRTPEIKKMPVLAVSYKTAMEILKRKKDTYEITVEGDKREREESQNVVAKIKGKNDLWCAIVAHYDTAPFCPGALDNTGSVAVLLECAARLKNEKLDATVYLVAIGSEEFGMNDGTSKGGREFWASMKNDFKNCIGMLDLDGVGHLVSMPAAYMRGNRKFRDEVVKAIDTKKYRLMDQEEIMGDDGSAIQNSIPSVWLTDGFMQVCWLHTPDDTPELVDFSALVKVAGDTESIIKQLSRMHPPYNFIQEGECLLRPARYDDLEAISEITKLSFGPVSMDRMKEDFFGEKIGGKPWYEYKIANVVDYCREYIDRTVVVETKGKVVGYATYVLDKARGIAEVSNTAVHPDFQGKGLGKLMHNEVKQRMIDEGYSKLMVMTLANDIPAQKVYERSGFIKYTEQLHYLLDLREKK